MNDVTSYPLGWSTKNLNDVTSLITDGAHFSPVPQEYGELIANVKDFGEQGIKYETCTKILEKDFNYLVRQNCSPKKGDILLSKDGTIGKVILFPGEMSIVLLSSIAIIRLINEYDSDYTKHALRSFIFDKQLYALQSGSALSRIVLSDIRKLEIPYPELNQQQKNRQNPNHRRQPHRKNSSPDRQIHRHKTRHDGRSLHPWHRPQWHT